MDQKYLHIPDVLTFGFHFTLHADVNTVCFADETDHLIYSGSDDSFCKVCSTIRWLLLLCCYYDLILLSMRSHTSARYVLQ